MPNEVMLEAVTTVERPEWAIMIPTCDRNAASGQRLGRIYMTLRPNCELCGACLSSHPWLLDH